MGSPEHHESGLGSNAVEGTDQQRLPLDDRLLCFAGVHTATEQGSSTRLVYVLELETDPIGT